MNRCLSAALAGLACDVLFHADRQGRHYVDCATKSAPKSRRYVVSSVARWRRDPGPMKMVSVGRLGVSVLLLLAVAGAGCGSPHKDAQPEQQKQEPLQQQFQGAELRTAGYRVTAQGAPGLVVAPKQASAGGLPDFVSPAGDAVSVTLPHDAQPAQPLTVTFDFTGTTPPRSGDGFVPAVVAIGEGVDEPEILVSQWDPIRSTLTAKTEHLSGFFPVSIDFGGMVEGFGNAVNGFLGLQSAKPSCVGSVLKVDEVNYRLNPETIPAAWPCLSRNGSAISVDLKSNSPNAWIVRSEPPTTSMGVDVEPDVGYAINQAAYHTVFADAVGNGTLLLPGATTHLRFAPNTPPKTVVLRLDPGASLLNGFLVGMHAKFPKAALLDIPGMVDCLKPLKLDFEYDPSGTNDGAKLQPLLSCVTTVTGRLSTKPEGGVPVTAAQIAAKSLGAVLSMGTGLATQLAATLRGLADELSGTRTETITVVSDQPAVPEEGAGSSPTLAIDRVDVTSWAYDRVQGDTYVADNTGGKKVEVFWKSYAGQEQVRSGCKSTVHLEGPGTNTTKEVKGCDSYNSGTFLHAQSPGSYTVTVTVQQDGHPDTTANRTITIVPHK